MASSATQDPVKILLRGSKFKVLAVCLASNRASMRARKEVRTDSAFKAVSHLYRSILI
jgi:hypothetical protein